MFDSLARALLLVPVSVAELIELGGKISVYQFATCDVSVFVLAH